VVFLKKAVRNSKEGKTTLHYLVPEKAGTSNNLKRKKIRVEGNIGKKERKDVSSVTEYLREEKGVGAKKKQRSWREGVL